VMYAVARAAPVDVARIPVTFAASLATPVDVARILAMCVKSLSPNANAIGISECNVAV